MKYMLIADYFWISGQDNKPGTDLTLPTLELPIEVEVISHKDFHLFGDTTLEKNTKVFFSIPNDDRVFYSNYGWIFLELTEENHQKYEEYKALEKDYEEMKERKQSAWNELRTIHNI